MTLSVAGVALVQGVNLDQGNSCVAIHAPNDGGVIARREILHDCRLQIIRWRDRGSDDFGFLIGAPVVIGSDQRAITVIYQKSWTFA